MTANDFIAILPELIWASAGLLILIVDAVTNRDTFLIPAFALTAAAAAIAVSVYLLANEPRLAFLAMVSSDGLSNAGRIIVAVATGLSMLGASRYIKSRSIPQGAFYALMALGACGMSLVCAATDLIVLFLGIELLSISLYVLVGLDRAKSQSGEGALKYLLLGAFASAFLLFGIALIFGATATTSLIVLKQTMSSREVTLPLIIAGVALLLVGLGFKLSFVPFHMWTPDAYEGAPTPVTAWMASATKAAIFVGVIRVFVFGLGGLIADWRAPLATLAVVTIVVGSIIAIAQSDLKRMLAYSSISHSGFITLGLLSGTSDGVSAVVTYIAIYAVMTIGAFLIVGSLGEATSLDSVAGLSKSNPLKAAFLALILLSMAGIPPTGGFLAKLFVFTSALRAGFGPLVVAATIASVIAAFFYIRVIVVMYMSEPTQPAPVALTRHAVTAYFCAAAIAIVGLFPSPLISMSDAAGKAATEDASTLTNRPQTSIDASYNPERLRLPAK